MLLMRPREDRDQLEPIGSISARHDGWGCEQMQNGSENLELVEVEEDVRGSSWSSTLRISRSESKISRPQGVIMTR